VSDAENSKVAFPFRAPSQDSKGLLSLLRAEGMVIFFGMTAVGG
jgi:hypothetical protein